MTTITNSLPSPALANPVCRDPDDDAAQALDRLNQAYTPPAGI